MKKKAVSTEARHFAYYKWLRSLYGYQYPDQTSLCPYVQTIIWGSVFCVILSPLLLSGWLMMRVGRTIMKLEGFWFDKFFNYFDDTTIVVALNDGPTNFNESPLLSGVLYTIVGMGVLSVVIIAVAVVCGLIWGFGLGVLNIGAVGAAIATGIMGLGWGMFFLFGSIGLLMNFVGVGLHWVFTNAGLWTTIGTWILYIFSMCIVGVIVGYVAMLIARIKIVQRLWEAIVTKANGFVAARKDRQDRVKEARIEKLKRMPDVKCSYCDHMNEPTIDCCTNCFYPLRGKVCLYVRCIDAVIMKPLDVLFGSIKRFGTTEVHLLGWVSIFWEFIKAIKKGVCPIIEFVTPTELQERAQKGAEKTK